MAGTHQMEAIDAGCYPLADDPAIERKAERDAVVRWLREQKRDAKQHQNADYGEGEYNAFEFAAYRIERGDHLKD